ncbi:branched-chain amino acid aminotransferase [Reichenbachiella agariperforans]|uniref:Branched-chain-amino-acid aminotransferase n=1 Tax=Reichenbachiella agariperforans TaxID=156994 RepID=A0A1M6R4K4_REIAG|nr:branched-chain amino acid transaminase [Reichenbachiella agariperforans]SHK27330.1 branched-chain amino acid aminotransferase [Reichenbachiella agariperforans]
MYYNENSILYLDGQWLKASEAKVNLYSQTMHHGNGVFEGIRSYGSAAGPNIFKAKQHFERLKFSAERMAIKFPYSVDELVKISYELIEKNNLENAYIRPLIYLGANMKLITCGETHIMMATWEWPPYLGDESLKVMISSYQRPNPKSIPIEAKVTGNYTNSILATNEAKREGYDEALLLDSDGYVSEGSGQNFFFVKDGVIYTPPLGNILPGITRATIIEYAMELGYPVVEKLFVPEDMRGGEVAFFTGTATEVASISSIGDIEFKKDWKETVAYELFQMYRARVTNEELSESAVG